MEEMSTATTDAATTREEETDLERAETAGLDLPTPTHPPIQGRQHLCFSRITDAEQAPTTPAEKEEYERMVSLILQMSQMRQVNGWPLENTAASENSTIATREGHDVPTSIDVHSMNSTTTRFFRSHLPRS